MKLSINKKHMPTSKKSAPGKSQASEQDFKAMAKEKIHEEIDRLSKMLSTVKTKFDNMDDQTKKKIVTGVAGTAALIAGVIGVNKISKKCNCKKK
jgi:hypothetical protein